MKTKITFLLFFIFQIAAFCQPKLTREVSRFWDFNLQEWKNSSETVYQYNEQKELILQTESLWYDSNNRFIGEKQITYDYSSQSTFISEFRSIFFEDDFYWILSDTSYYVLDDAGCRTQFFENAEFVQWRWDYDYFDNCQIKSSTKYIKNLAIPGDDWQPSERTKYTYNNDDSEINYIIESYIGNDEWSIYSIGHEYYDANGNLTERFSSNDPYELWEYTYNEKDQLIHEFLYRPAGPNDVLTLRRETKYEYSEDENGFVVKMLLLRRYDPDVEFDIHTFFYENYCDGLVKTEEYLRFDGTTRRQWSYEYDEALTCLDDEAIAVQISPNPSSGIVTISSNLLSQNTTISIFSSNGQLVRTISNSQRSELQELDLGSLPNGLYYARLKSTQHSISEPFVIMK